MPSACRSLANRHPFSLVGIPGGVEGAGWTKIPVETDEELNDPSAGDIHADPQLNQAAANPLAQKHYDLVAPDHLTFDTRVGDAQPTSNTMLIGGQSVTAELPAGATAGFHVALADSMTGHVFVNTVLATNGGAFDAAQEAVGAKLLEYSKHAGATGPFRPEHRAPARVDARVGVRRRGAAALRQQLLRRPGAR